MTLLRATGERATIISNTRDARTTNSSIISTTKNGNPETRSIDKWRASLTDELKAS